MSEKKNSENLNKVRDRTEQELLVRKTEFLKICKILDDLKIEYYLQTGILLGAVRNNNLIPWDWDIEISVFSEKFAPHIDEVANSLKKNDFKIKNIVRKTEQIKIDFVGKYPDNVTGYTIFGWNYSKIKDHYWRKEFVVPSKFLNSFSQISFFGREFNCPFNPEEYLTHAYGNWKKPLRSSDKKAYFNKNFKINYLYLYNKFKNLILKTLYNLWCKLTNKNRL